MDDLQIEPQEVNRRLAAGEPLVLLDVRELWEHQLCRLEGAMAVPMQELPARVEWLEGAGEVVVYCHHGIRSVDAAAWLRQQGVEKARSMTGGIDRWSREIDPSIPRY
ncbi:MAG TPA: rhodanese-like domain-containing protein [Candidatus Acidoferrales bacterium]|nr:rhodanese-like domain-containing protein [Candidatus Acidoferrales bacterium]